MEQVLNITVFDFESSESLEREESVIIAVSIFLRASCPSLYPIIIYRDKIQTQKINNILSQNANMKKSSRFATLYIVLYPSN